MSGPDLGFVHRVDQAQASAFARISNLLEWITDWLTGQGFSGEELSDALEDPMMFLALVRIMRERVAVEELPGLLAAAVIRVAVERLESG